MLTLCEGTCKILCLMDVEMVLDPFRIRTLKARYLLFICLFLSFALVLFDFSFMMEKHREMFIFLSSSQCSYFQTELIFRLQIDFCIIKGDFGGQKNPNPSKKLAAWLWTTASVYCCYNEQVHFSFSAGRDNANSRVCPCLLLSSIWNAHESIPTPCSGTVLLCNSAWWRFAKKQCASLPTLAGFGDVLVVLHLC